MAKLTLTDVANLTGAEATAISTLNTNWDAVIAALENTLSRDGTTPNTMSADFDMNSNDILNANVVNTTSMVLGGVTVTAASGMVSGASVLAALLTADGAGSGLDADLLDGNQAAAFPLVANNLSDLASAATARTNLGVVIGSDVQAWNANLDTLAGIAPGAAGQAILADATAADVISYLDVKALNVDDGFTFATTIAPTQDFMPSGLLGGSYDAVHVARSDDTATAYTGMRATGAFSRVVTGTGSNNPNSDHGLIAIAAKDDLSGSTLGEVGAIRGWSFQNAWGDSSGLLLGAYKKVGDGTANEGAAVGIELTTRRFTTDLSTYDHWMNNIIGFSPNPTATWGGRELIGFYSENHLGAGFANFLGITDGAEAGTGTMTYLLAGFRSRNVASRYFSVDDDGNIESIWNDTGATGGSWKRYKDSASPAANDVLWNDYWVGEDSAGNETTYARLYGAIADATSASEDGLLQFRTIVNATETDQLKIQNGLAIGSPTSGTLATGTLNLAGLLANNGTTTIENNGAHRQKVTTTTALGAIGNAVNTANKAQGTTYYASDTQLMYVANGNTAGSGWYPSNGAAAIIPA